MTLSPEFQKKASLVFAKLHLTTPVLLGMGGEGPVYEYGDDKVLKVYPRTVDMLYLQNIQSFQRDLAKHTFTFATPQITEIGQTDGVLYTVEKRLQGTQGDKKIIGLHTADRQRVYRSYYDAIRQVNKVTFPTLPYGQLIKTSESITSDSWTDFLIHVLEQKVEKTQENVRGVVVDFDKKVERFKDLIQQHLTSTQKQLVHSDYFLNNVLVGDNLSVTAVLDFSVHAAVGDPRLDIAGVLTWNEIDPHIKPEDYQFLYAVAEKDYGKEISKIADLYLLFSSFYFSDMDDPGFSIRNLNNEELWEKE